MALKEKNAGILPVLAVPPSFHHIPKINSPIYFPSLTNQQSRSSVGSAFHVRSTYKWLPAGEIVGEVAANDSAGEKSWMKPPVGPESHVRSARRKWYSTRGGTVRFKGSLAMGTAMGVVVGWAGEKVPRSRCKSPFVTDRSKAEQICVTYI